MIPIIVTCNPDEPRWQDDFSESLRLTWPQEWPLPVVHYYQGWELDAIKWTSEQDFDRFLLLQDSILVKNSGFWAKFDEFDGESALLMPRPNCYMGIYDTKLLRELFKTPDLYNWGIRGQTAAEKKEYSLYYEFAFQERYGELYGPMDAIFRDLTDRNAKKIEFRYDKDRLVLENDYMIKYKGTWTGKFGYYKGVKQ